MTNEQDFSYAICFNCASLYSLSITDQYTCPYCKHSFDADFYKEILDYAKTAVYYGYDYRKKYEEQIQAEGKITTRYYLSDPFAIACFIGVAALSGIIGNASYDLVKKAIGKIKRSSEKIPHDIGQGKVEIFNETNINIFLQCIQEFHDDNLAATDEIKYEVAKERLISNLTKKMLPLLRTKSNPSQEEIHDAVSKAFNEYQNLQKPPSEGFDSFWKDVDNE